MRFASCFIFLNYLYFSFGVITTPITKDKLVNRSQIILDVMRYIYLLLILLTFRTPLTATAQITTNPSFPVASQSVIITFDSSQESRLGKFTGDLYAHTGVIIEGESSWKHVIGEWAQNSIQPKLTHQGDGIYTLEITPDINTFYSIDQEEKITKMALVFRSSDGSKQTNDLFVNVYEDGINVSFSSPKNEQIITRDEPLNIEVNATGNEQIDLLWDGKLIKSVTGQKLTHTLTSENPGSHTLKAIATMGDNTRETTITVFVRKDVVSTPLPFGVRKGINYINDRSATLVLFAPGKEFIYVIGDFNNWEIDESYQMKKDGDTFWLEISDLTSGHEYCFQYLIDGEIRIADPYTEKVSDPWNDQYISETTYPDLIDYPEGKTTNIASVLQTGQTPFVWSDADFTAPQRENLIIYEMLIRDFTLQGNLKSAITKLDYLDTLGVNAIELMPFNEFEGNSSWGYNPSFYFAPDKAYGTKEDYKIFINECHRRGIAVIMDMVLNHSFSQSPLLQMYFDGTRPTIDNPWYNKDYNFQNKDAQWGYDFNHESTHTQELIDSINSFWMNHYHIDGFRFDFTKGFSNTPYGPSSWGSSYDADRIRILKRMSDEIWKRNPEAILIFEHLADNSEEKELAAHNIMLWGNANHNYNEATMGWNEDGKSDFGWTSWINKGWNQPGLISYMESHDEERLMYKNLQYANSYLDYNAKELNTALSRMEMANAFFLTIPGPKMIWQFGEFGYDISINQNGRTGEKPVLWEYLDSDNRKRLFQINAALIKLKKEQPAFQSNNFSISAQEAMKLIEINHQDMDVRIIGNFDVKKGTIYPNFSSAGIWYDYFSGAEINISDPSAPLELTPGEYHVYTSKKLEKPDILNLITTGIDDNVKKPDIRIYPNPVSDLLFLNNIQNVKQITVSNITGRQVINVTNHKARSSFDFNKLPAGVYLMTLYMNDGTKFTYKIINR